MSKNDSVPMRSLTAEDFDRFHKSAPSVLESRTWGYFLGEMETSIHLVLSGVIPIVGVLVWDWSATNWIVFLLIGCWLGLVCDVIRLTFLNRQIEKYWNRVIEDTFVSVVSEAVRAEKSEVVAAHVPSQPEYRVGIFVDLIFGGIATFLIAEKLPENLTAEIFGRPWFLPSLAMFIAYRLGMTAWEIVDQHIHPRKKPVIKLALGLRGGCMFFAMFVVMICCDEARAVGTERYAVYGINGAMILVGLLNLGGMFMIIGETRWLRKYLGEKGASNEPDARASDTNR